MILPRRIRPASAALLLALAACRSAAPTAPAAAAAPASPVGDPLAAARSEPQPAAAGEAPAPIRNTVHWSTASEVDNFGYDVYRAESRDGPFVRITPRPILGAGTSDDTHQYEYVDATIAPGRIYFYYVESIDLTGSRQRFTPVIEAPAKGSPP